VRGSAGVGYVIGQFDADDSRQGIQLPIRAEDIDMRLQRTCRGSKAYSVLIYEQTCATKKRRRARTRARWRPKRFCLQSTGPSARLRRIARSSNASEIRAAGALKLAAASARSTCRVPTRIFSCLNGFCPRAFVTLEGDCAAQENAVPEWISPASCPHINPSVLPKVARRPY